MTEYVTIQGDMWDSIAYKVYGSESGMAELMAANPDHLNTVIFGAGIRLVVPVASVPNDNRLPPWKKGVP